MLKYCVEHKGKQYEGEAVRAEKKNKRSAITDFWFCRRKKALGESLQRELEDTVKSFKDVSSENISYLIQELGSGTRKLS